MKETEETKEPIHTKGAINYTIIEYPDGSWRVDYESTTENDLAAMEISQHLSDIIVNGLRVTKATSKNTKDKKHIQVLIDKGSAARFGLKMLIDYMQPLYKQFKESLKANQEVYDKN